MSAEETITNDGEYFTDQFLSLSFYGQPLRAGAEESDDVEVMSSQRRKRRASVSKGRYSHVMCLRGRVHVPGHI